MFRHRRILALVSFLLISVAAPLLLTACAVDNTEGTGGGESAARSTGGKNARDVGKSAALPVGTKTANKTVEEIAVTKVTAVSSLTAPEATALLFKNESGENRESEVQAGAGKEFLLVTLAFTPKDGPLSITPTAVRLEDSENNEFSETPTNGRAGLFNMIAVEPKASGSVTAVYEVPKGKTDLVLIYEPATGDAVAFNVR